MKQKSKLSQNSLKPILLMSIEYRMKQSFYNLYSTLKIENLCEKAWQKSTIKKIREESLEGINLCATTYVQNCELWQ